MLDGIRVKLKVDLTKYNTELRPGIEGVTAGQSGLWSRGSDRFIGVNFPGVGTYDVLWEGLEVIDEQYLRRMAEFERKRDEDARLATDVVETRGPRGGFKHLSYTCPSGFTGTGSRDEYEHLMKIFKEAGIPVRVELQGNSSR